MITLSGLTWKNPRGELPLLASAKLWQETHPGIRIQWHALPWYDFETALLKSLDTLEADYDLAMFDHPWTGSLAASGGLVPWEDLLNQKDLGDINTRIVSPSYDSYYWNQRLWGLPLDGACHAGLYRSDLIDTADLPTAWEDIEQWAKNAVSPKLPYPLVLSVSNVLGSCLFLSMMATYGKPVAMVDGELSYDHTAATAVLETLKALLAFVPPGSAKWGPWDIYDYLCAEDTTAFSPSIFAYVNYLSPTGRGASLRLRETPSMAGNRGTPILGGVGLGVLKKCRYPEAAAEYGKYLISDEVQVNLFPEHSGQPAARAAWEDPLLNQRFHGFYEVLGAEMSHAYMRPRVPGFHFTELEIGRKLQAFWDGDTSLGATLDQLKTIRKESHVLG